MVATQAHLARLTSLRFFAAAAVMVFHIAKFLDPIASLKYVSGAGYTGVGFFFVLSGFVLTWAHRPSDTAGHFYWRRVARVYPLHVLTLVLSMVVAVIVGDAVNWWALPANLTLTQSWLAASDFRYSFNGVSWSLSCEVLFYLLFPLCIGVLLRAKRLFVVAFAVAAAMVIVAGIAAVMLPTDQLGWLLYSLPAYRFGEFLLGMLLAVGIQRGWAPTWSLRSSLVTMLVSYTVLIAAMDVALGDPERLPYFVADIWMLPTFCMVIAAGARADIAGERGPLTGETLVRLGRWSFALYLVHELVLRLAEPVVDPLSWQAGIVAGILVFAVAVALSGVLHECFEAPVEKRLRNMLRHKDPLAARKLVSSS